MRKNPYTLTFGRSPEQMIERLAQMNEIIQVFRAEPPAQQAYVITGVRGAGKTVFMTEAVRRLERWSEWITVELNPERELLTGLAAKLASESALASIFRGAKIDLSFFGFGVELADASPITDIEVALSRMLSSLRKHGKKVLIAIDEVSNSKDMRVFAHAFQIFLRQELPVYLLMTGLYENIYSLQNEKTMSFLYRVPKLHLAPLSLGAIADNYMTAMELPRETAVEMARLTKGYPFAFQVLGYLTFEREGDHRAVLPLFRQYLAEYVYEKIWSELSNNDRRVLTAMTQAASDRVADIRAVLSVDTNSFNPYRSRLIRRGLVNGDVYGRLTFALPFFGEFIAEQGYE